MTRRRTGLAKHRYLGLAALLFAPVMLGAKGCDVAVVGSECGGLSGATCGSGEFCDFEIEAACGAADQTGSCSDIPRRCTREFNPVCGCDDETYNNACEAHAAGVSVASEGACGSEGSACAGLLGLACGDGEFCNFAPDAFCGATDQTGTCEPTPEVCLEIFAPVCGCDDVTYGNACEANVAGVSVASEGPCQGDGGSACGGLLGLQCNEDEFCNFAPDAFCGAADQTGTCEPIPDACDAVLDPVCGCDGRTYDNACEANVAGTSVVSAGECGGGGNACGGLLGLQCGEDEFCNFAPDALCGAADQTGVCTATPEACEDILDPVCGCNDQTYPNACEANVAGVSVASRGACGGSGGTVCGGLLGGGCGDGEFCNIPIDGICGAADATGICQARPEVCTLQFDPVCGCDGKTYGNACEAGIEGVSIASQGRCEGDGADCGGLLGLECADGEFCNFALEASCGAADQTGKCELIPDVCTFELNPVCGCDGNDYDNACAAHAAGVSVVSSGACP